MTTDALVLSVDPKLLAKMPSPTGFILRPDVMLRSQLNEGAPTRSFTCMGAEDTPFPNHKIALWVGEERFIPPGHPGQDYVERSYGKMASEVVAGLIGDPSNVFGIPILEVEDEAGHQLRYVRIEPRVFHKDCPERLPVQTMVILPELAVLHRPRSFSETDPARALAAATPHRGVLERFALLKSREAVEIAEAFAAFEVLFKHYSFNEELWRLEEWMQDHLPWSLEEHPGMEKYRELMKVQTGHLKQGAARWYREESPAADVTLELYVQTIAPNPQMLPIRLRWLIDECRKQGFKRVAEFGAIEGVSLFHLIQIAPDIEWHGFEVNPKIVEKGIELAKKAGLSDRFHLHVMDGTYHRESLRSFDAVALFEALEHNNEPEGAQLLNRAQGLVRPGGEVFITTPWGNWSAFDDHTRDLKLRKDHINAYTERRMERFLEKHAARMIPDSLKVERVINPSLHEYNSWVFAHYALR